jgi:hypothetical protein
VTLFARVQSGIPLGRREARDGAAMNGLLRNSGNLERGRICAKSRRFHLPINVRGLHGRTTPHFTQTSCFLVPRDVSDISFPSVSRFASLMENYYYYYIELKIIIIIIIITVINQGDMR